MLWGEQDVQGRARRLFPGGLLPRPKRGGGEAPPQPAALSEAALLSLLSSNPCCAWKVRAGARSRAPLPGPAAAGFGKRAQPWHEAVGAVLAACRRKRRSRGEEEKPSSMPRAPTGASWGGETRQQLLWLPQKLAAGHPRGPHPARMLRASSRAAQPHCTGISLLYPSGVSPQPCSQQPPPPPHPQRGLWGPPAPSRAPAKPRGLCAPAVFALARLAGCSFPSPAINKTTP